MTQKMYYLLSIFLIIETRAKQQILTFYKSEP